MPTVDEIHQTETEVSISTMWSNQDSDQSWRIRGKKATKEAIKSSGLRLTVNNKDRLRCFALQFWACVIVLFRRTMTQSTKGAKVCVQRHHITASRWTSKGGSQEACGHVDKPTIKTTILYRFAILNFKEEEKKDLYLSSWALSWMIVWSCASLDDYVKRPKIFWNIRFNVDVNKPRRNWKLQLYFPNVYFSKTIGASMAAGFYIQTLANFI